MSATNNWFNAPKKENNPESLEIWRSSCDKADFNYAFAILQNQDQGYDLSNTNIIVRDSVFEYVLSLFNENPIKIFQVGAIESLDSIFRVGSGWSDIIFGKYINKFGGAIDIVDVNLDHLAHSGLMGAGLGYKIKICLGDAIDYICDGYDIYYLDGAEGDVGNRQTFQQFKKIEDTKSVVLVDDIRSKAISLIDHLQKKNIAFETYNVANGMIVIDMR